MKNNKAIAIGFSFAGSILGAGYLSGQELLQFFGVFGIWGIIGLVVTLLLLVFLASCVMEIANTSSIMEMDKIIIPWNQRILRSIVSFLEIFFFLATVVIMLAGGGSLINELFNLPVWTGSLIMTILVVVFAYFGISGAMKIFSLLVPIMAVVTLAFSIATISKFGFPFVPESQGGENPLLNNWIISAITFTAYNFFSAIGMLAPMGAIANSKKSIYGGSVFGAGVLMIIALSVILAIFACPQSVSSDLPMLFIAREISPVLSYIYGIILLFGMFGCSLYSIVAVLVFLQSKSEKLKKFKPAFLVGVAVVCYPLSLFGFGDLISVIYPLTGYLSVIFIACMVYHFVIVKRKNKLKAKKKDDCLIDNAKEKEAN